MIGRHAAYFYTFMKKKYSFIYETISIILVSFILATLVRHFFVSTVVVSGSSMVPSLNNGEVGLSFVFNKHHIERFDIVIVELDDKQIVKRVIGLPNDTVEYIDNCLYINGEEMSEDYLALDAYTEDLKITLHENEYFLLGDNRNISRDSRYYGPFEKDDIVANGLFIFYPFNALGFK